MDQHTFSFDSYASARSLISDLSSGGVTASELLEHCLQRFLEVNPGINAVIRTDQERARQVATGLDASQSPTGPLHGLPMTIKDAFDVDGMPATSGAEKYARRSDKVSDALAVNRLKSAGAVIWGKTNTPYLSGDNQTFNNLYGVTNNPHDLRLTPGGSSGGSAAALAAGVTALELGSDIGGSLRLPAHFCGVCALKPSYGLISQRGHIPPAPGSLFERPLNVVGPMARNVGDLRLACSVLANRKCKEADLDMSERRLAIWSEEEEFSLSEDSAEAVNRAVFAAMDCGAHLAKAKPDIHGPTMLDVYVRLVVAVLSEDLPYLTRKLLELYRPLAHLTLNDKPFSRARWALSATSRYHDWVAANEMREKLKHAASRFFESWDAIIAPVCAITAFPHDLRGGLFNRRMIVDGKEEPYVSYLSWISLASVCDLPAVVIPAGRSSAGLPVGVQVIGAQGCDEKVLDIAEALEQKLGGFQPPSAYA